MLGIECLVFGGLCLGCCQPLGSGVKPFRVKHPRVLSKSHTYPVRAESRG